MQFNYLFFSKKKCFLMSGDQIIVGWFSDVRNVFKAMFDDCRHL